MLDFMVMCLLVMFLFLLILGFSFGLVVSSWDLFVVAAAGILTMWVILCLRRD